VYRELVEGEEAQRRDLHGSLCAAVALLDAAVAEAELRRVHADADAAVRLARAVAEDEAVARALALAASQLRRRAAECASLAEQQLRARMVGTGGTGGQQREQQLALEARLDVAEQRENDALVDAQQAESAKLAAALDAVKATFDAESHAVEARMLVERRRQQDAMQRRLAARQEQRRRAMEQRHAMELMQHSGDADAAARTSKRHELEVLAAKDTDAAEDRALAAAATTAAALMEASGGALSRQQAVHDDMGAQVSVEAVACRLAGVRDGVTAAKAAQDARSDRLSLARAAHAALLAANGASPLAAGALRERMVAETTQALADIKDDALTRADAAKRRDARRIDAFALKLAGVQADVDEELEAVKASFEEESNRLSARMLAERRRQQATLARQLEQQAARKRRQLVHQQTLQVAQAAAQHSTEMQNVTADAEHVADGSWEAQLLSAVREHGEALEVVPEGDEEDGDGLSTARSSAEAAPGAHGGGGGGGGGVAVSPSRSGSLTQVTALVRAGSLAKKLLRSQANAVKELDERQRVEAAALAAKLDEEARVAAARAASAAAESRAQALAAKRREFEARLAGRNATTDDEMRALKEEFERDAAAHADAVAEERARQQAKLQERLEAKRQAKQRELARRQERERAALLSSQAAAASEARAAEELSRERAALSRVLHSGDAVVAAGSAGDAIETVLQQRHTREMSELFALQYSERVATLRSALEELFEARRLEKVELLQRLEDDHAPEDVVHTAVAQLEARFERRRAEVERECVAAMEVKHASQHIDLRQRQLNEIASTMQELAPQDVARRAEAEQAMRDADELRRFQVEMERERVERVERNRREKEAFEERMRQQVWLWCVRVSE
jgi:hypothetical protein